ncbi:hypothetical protein [Nocardia aobensis]|uniref:hypothetical protein n=1 Tax=Nocardia aobensis TaxID=257277 RepID=UPI00272DEA0A|nr:hypothetical protein [Nocardia aobensis]
MDAQVSRSDARQHPSEHHGDGTPGSVVWSRGWRLTTPADYREPCGYRARAARRTVGAAYWMA